MIREIEIEDGRIIAKYDDETGEVIESYDWHGNELSYRAERMVDEAVADRMAELKEKGTSL